MKDPSSPMDVCPFCGKAFKRLKSHLPHCKMAENKSKTTRSDPGDQSRTAKQVPMKRTGTTLSNVDKQDMKVKAKSKTGLKIQVQQDKTISSSRTTATKVRKVTSENMMTQQKAVATIEESKKALQTAIRTSQMVTLPKEQDQQLVALAEPMLPIQQAIILKTNLERSVPITVESPRLGNAETVRDQVSTKKFDGDLIRLFVPNRISEKDIVVSSDGVWPHRQVHLDQNFVSKFPSGCTKALMVFEWSTNFPQEGVKTQIPGIAQVGCNIKAEMHDIKALGTGKSMEIKMDVIFPPKTMKIVDGHLGLHWFPQLYPNYVQLCIVPGRQDQWDPLGRGTRMSDPIRNLPEVSKIARTESMLESQSTSKGLMDVRLGELPNWLANHSFTPRNLTIFMANAWERYYNKYINVKKGGAGGLTMLLAGYCVLSYSWNFDHIRSLEKIPLMTSQVP
ncbi:mitochondrial nucleoid-associated protein 1 isoform X1 [Ranitomeya variabilis]|uniref:mitochondrial nucleoid-associated protein 1 isoform X1 n=1 Tax=Ranitomeya variabilis TaxID=490064 RepID=UPI0040576E64